MRSKCKAEVAVHSRHGKLRAAVIAPRVVPTDFIELLRREVVLDVELGPNLLRSFPLDHVRDGLAGQVEQRLDVQKVRSLQWKKGLRKETKVHC